jgi:bacillithiol biosynthesis cysteine-adding enzyme BshC
LQADCTPIAQVPQSSALFRDFLQEDRLDLNAFYSPLRHSGQWMRQASCVEPERRAAIAQLLAEQNKNLGASAEALANVQRLAQGASAVVTGQQVGLFGGPLLTLLKAATAIHHAEQATRAGHACVPIFWLASEDHDWAEVNQATLPAPWPRGTAHNAALDALANGGLRTLRLPANPAHAQPVGALPLGPDVHPLLDEARTLLGYGPAHALLADCYQPEATLAQAFARMMLQIFARQGLLVIDAAARPMHALGAPVLRAAIEQAEPLHAALLARQKALTEAGYSAQVLVAESSSLLFLLNAKTGAREALHRHAGGQWMAGGHTYSAADLLAILDAEPERLSPNALLRPVLQDALLPVAAYVGGPAEIAYFAQSEVVYQKILSRTTPILPRLSATLIEPEMAHLLARYGIGLQEVWHDPESLAQRLAARQMSVEGKRKLASAGEMIDRELQAVTAWMESVDTGLGHSAAVAASKMRYQMNRLRRLAANFELERTPVLRRHATLLRQQLFPNAHLQERVLSAASFVRKDPAALAATLVEAAAHGCDGHLCLTL